VDGRHSLSSDKQHLNLNYDVCQEVRGWSDYQNYSVLYCVLKLCAVIRTLRCAVLTFIWIGFCHTGPISLCINLFVFICVYFVCLVSYCIVVVLLWVWWGGPDGMEASSLEPNLSSVLWHWWLGHWLVKPVPDMTYNVFFGTLNLAQSIN